MAIRRRKHPPDPRIRTRIRAAMKSYDMNQNDLADMLGLSAASVSLFLSGQTRPRDDTVRRIADGLGEDFDFLMGYKDTATKGRGRTIGHILGKSTAEELDLLEEIPEDAYHEMMGELALKYRKRKRKKPKTTLISLILLTGIVATALGTASFEHWHHDVDPILFSPPPSDCFHTAAFNCPCDHRHSMTPPRTAG
jgi:transcriptional regulator with XRE-family HTH domain